MRFINPKRQKEWEAIPEKIKREYKKRFEMRTKINKMKKSTKPTKWDD